jgi:amidophosphoribosyltransferase
MQVCSFLWVYYGYPASRYEGRNVEAVRYMCGAALARADREDIDGGKLNIDLVAGIPDSGTSHAIGYANEARIPFMRPFVKYTPTWPRSFMPQDQSIRDLVAQKKLIPIPELIDGKSILFCEDSIVRGTQLRDNVDVLFELGAREVHMRPACPPLIYGCNYLNFSRSRSLRDLAGIRAIEALEGIPPGEPVNPEVVLGYMEGTANFRRMVDWIREDLHLTTLRYQRLKDLVAAIGVPQEKLCKHCWDGKSNY